MDGVKGFFESKAIWGGIAALAAGGVGIGGYTMSADDARQAILLVQGIMSSLAGLVAIWGRVKATKRIG